MSEKFTPLENNDENLQNKTNKEKVHIVEEWFNELGQYEVQKEDWTETLYSILQQSINRNIQLKDRMIFRKIMMENLDQFNTIKKWDIIELNQIDNNSFEIKVWQEYYVINSYNETFIKIWEQEEVDKMLDQYELSDEQVETLVNAIDIETNKAQIWMFAWKMDTYTIKVWNFIEWNLPNNAEPIDLLVPIDPQKVVKKAKQVMMWWDIDQVDINELVFDNQKTNIDSDSSQKVLSEFKWFVTSLVEWKNYKVYRTISSTD